MRRLLSALVVVISFVSYGWAAGPEPLTSLQAISSLSNAEAAQRQQVSFPATVVYSSAAELDVQDGAVAIFVRNKNDVTFLPGDRVLVQGNVEPSFLPYVISNKITFLHHGELPQAIPATFGDLIHSQLNCRFVRVHGIVRAGDLLPPPRLPRGRLELLMDGGYINIEVESNDRAALKELIDDEVEVTGAAGRIFDGKMQQVGAKVKVSSLADIRVLKPGNQSQQSLPLTPLGQIVTGYHIRDLSETIRVHGTITYYEPGSAAVLQEGDSSLWVESLTSNPMRIGDEADAIGIPDTHDGHLTLTHTPRSGTKAPKSPSRPGWQPPGNSGFGL